jgi:hypothetical protein
LRGRLSVNSAIEIHDSVVARIETAGRDVVIRLSPAYVHRTEGRPLIDPGTGWVQDLDLVIADAWVASLPDEMPGWLIDGSLMLGEDVRLNTIPLPLKFRGRVRLSAVTDRAEDLIVMGSGAEVIPRGDLRYVEESP